MHESRLPWFGVGQRPALCVQVAWLWCLTLANFSEFDQVKKVAQSLVQALQRLASTSASGATSSTASASSTQPGASITASASTVFRWASEPRTDLPANAAGLPFSTADSVARLARVFLMLSNWSTPSIQLSLMSLPHWTNKPASMPRFLNKVQLSCARAEAVPRWPTQFQKHLHSRAMCGARDSQMHS